MNEISLCLPKGEHLGIVASFLKEAGFPIKGYTADNRTYRPIVNEIDNVRAKIFAEKDVAIQVAVGNYSIGFCGLAWIEEYRRKFPNSELRILRKLGIDKKTIYACCHKSLEGISIEEFKQRHSQIRMVSEFPNLCEDFALNNRFRGFKVFSAWGSVEPYVPEHAELVVLTVKEMDSLAAHDLAPIASVLESELCLVINQRDYENEDLSPVLRYLTYASQL